MFLEAWAGDLVVRRLSQRDIQHFCAQRRAGALTPFHQVEGKNGRKKGRKPVSVRDGTLAGDFRWLSAAFNFGRDALALTVCGASVPGRRAYNTVLVQNFFEELRRVVPD